MKKPWCHIITLLLLFPIAVSAQSFLKIHKTDGSFDHVLISDIDRIVFSDTVPGLLRLPLINPSADKGVEGWNISGAEGTDTMSVSGRTVFYLASTESTEATLTQEISLPIDSEYQFLLIIAYAWVEYTVDDTLTHHPYLYAIERDAADNILADLQGIGMVHTAGTKYWQTVSGIFRTNINARSVALHLEQGTPTSNPADGTRAVFDDIELNLFRTEIEAETYRDAYILSHPMIYEGNY